MEKVGVWKDSRDNKSYDVYKAGSQWWIPMFTYNSEDGFYTTSEALEVIPDGWQIAKQIDWIKLVGELGGLREVFFDFPKEWKGFVDPKGVVHNPQDDSNKANYYITGEENPVVFKKFTETIEYMNMTYPNVGYASGEVYHHKDDWASYKGLIALVTYTDPLVQNTLKSAAAAPEPTIGTEQLAEGVVMDLRDDKLYQVATIGNLQVFKDNLKFNLNGVYPYDANGCYYTADEMVGNICPDGWRVPNHKDIMYILNNLDLNDLRSDLINTLNLSYNGYVNTGTPLRLEWVNIINAMWINAFDFKSAFTFRMMKFNPTNKNSVYIERELETSDLVLNSYGLDFNKNFTTLANIRPVTGEVSLTQLTVLKGWNYWRFSELEGKTIETLFGNDSGVFFVKSIYNGDAEIYWKLDTGVVNTLSEFKGDRLYAIKSNANFRINL